MIRRIKITSNKDIKIKKKKEREREKLWIYQLSTILFSLALNSSEPNRLHSKTMK